MNFLFLVLVSLSAFAQSERVIAPVAPKHYFEINMHGDKRVDNYYWMLAYPGEEHTQEFLDYVTAENVYTEEKTKGIEGLRKELLGEMIARTADSDLSVPEKIGNYLYYSKTEAGKDYPLIVRKEITSDREEVLLDCNELAKGHDFFSLEGYALSPDQKKLLYREYYAGGVRSLFMKNLTTGETKLVRESDASYAGFAWSADGASVFYVTYDEAQRPYRVVQQNLATDESKVVYEERDSIFEIDELRKSGDGRFLYVEIGSKSTNETLFLNFEENGAELKVFSKRKAGHRYSVENHDGSFYVLSNKDGVNFGLYKTSEGRTESEHWQTLQAPQSTRYLKDLSMFKDFMVLFLRQDGLTQLEVFDFKSQTSNPVTFEEAVYDIELSEGTNVEYERSSFVFKYTSFLVPSRVYTYDVVKKEKSVLKETPVGGGFDPANYVVERKLVAVRDGVRVPVSLVYRKGTKLDGSTPLFLNAYGNYGSPFFFDWVHSFTVASISPLLDRGVIYGIAHIRGGGEMGPQWYFDGKLQKKLNTFNDFIDVSEWLIANNYTSSEKFGVRSLSAGGLLVGYLTNNRPELYKAVIAHAPFVDLLTTMTDEKIPLTTQEWEEWGNPNIELEYNYMRQYCPVSNVGAHAYPHMLVKTSLKDTQVMVHEPTKWVAKLRAMKTDSNELLLSVNTKGGHSGDSGRYAELEEVSLDLAWMLSKISN